MGTEVSLLAARLVEHQDCFSGLPRQHREWIIENPETAIGLFKQAVINRKQSLLLPVGSGILRGSECFVVAEHYREGEVTEGVKIIELDPCFKRFALSYVEEGVSDAQGITHVLTRDEKTLPIMSATVDVLKESFNTFTQFFEHLKIASHRHPVFSFIFFNNNNWVIAASWVPRFLNPGWKISLIECPNKEVWSEGDLLVTRKLSDV